MYSKEKPPHTIADDVIVHDDNPWNAETELAALVQHDITPVELIYGRNHGPIQKLDAATFRLKVAGLVQHEQQYYLADLKKCFTKFEVVAALQCAGNRRSAMKDRKHANVEGILWGEAAIANVVWGGVRLSDLLLHAGIAKAEGDEGLHVCFASHAAVCQEEDWFGSSVPLAKALSDDGDALVAYEMNGEELTHEHGYPFRIVVPGHVGARWVKWVDEIVVSNRESENYYHQQDYKALPSIVKTHEIADKEDWWSKVPPLQANFLTSVVAIVKTEVRSATPILFARGYALGSPSGQVKEVQVSIDQGKSWSPATITYQAGRWSWTLWEVTLKLPGNALHGKMYSRAMDETGERQHPESDWNLRGVGYSGFGKREY